MRSRVYKTVRCPSVRQSVCPISQTQQGRAAGLLLSAVRAKDIDRQRGAPGSSSAAARVRSTALSSKCGNVMLTAELTMLNTDNYIIYKADDFHLHALPVT